MSCQKKNNDTTISKEQILTSHKWIAEVSGTQQQVIFSADKTFKFSTNIIITAVTPNLNLNATVSGSWNYVGENIVINSPKIELLNNGTVVTNVQSIINGLPSNYYSLLSQALQQYNQYIEIDSNGNIKLSQAAADKFVWAIDQINDGILVITIGDQKIEFKKG